jgi:hypothetical protein
LPANDSLSGSLPRSDLIFAPLTANFLEPLCESYYIEKIRMALGSFGKLPLPGALGMSAWAIMPILGAVFLLLFLFFEIKGL